ncbi:FMN-dependent NADH-azoreductase [Marinomonas aquiplantarum]|uniref:FMN dependent NADH:quinone oxidoreductase n=1 Tax=Marinomonas aquiplantarum TaxID=491951 RepID=A0A366D621_9GAMM|nr:NAD(P)H-dependent oxidoreductase [Marinomonas aquiplantarum]RBO84748.1 FMN-dependent NADH-azoreductase [Marinomonas aquiplantarum]
MNNILHIDSSVRFAEGESSSHTSISKSLGQHFIQTWMKKNNLTKVVYRDLANNPPEFISMDWLAAAFTEKGGCSEWQKRVLEQSDLYYEEVKQADLILITAPMHNYGMPAVLKAWFDQVLRLNHTFTFDLKRGDFPIELMLFGKVLVLLTSTGEFGFQVGGVREEMNHLGPHVKLLGRYLGAESFYEIGSEFQEFKDVRHQHSIANARIQIESLVTDLLRP